MDEEGLRSRFLERLNGVLADAKVWLAEDDRIAIEERAFPIDDPFGKYNAPGPEIRVSGHRIVSIVPLSGVVIGAEGRVDVKGPLDDAAAIYLSGPGRMGATIEGVSALSYELFAGFSNSGWYWMLGGSNPSREVRRIDESVFRTMVESVSDFKVSPAR